MKTTPFDRYASLAAMAAGFVGLLYSISFVVLQNGLLSALCLLLGGLLSLAALVGLFQHLAPVDSSSAALGLILAAVSALGAAIHGGYDLANAIHAPGELTGAVANLPNPIDPRGMLTFGVAGLAVLLAGLLMRGSPRFGRGFTALTFTLGVLLIIVYLGRLVVLTASSPLVLLPAAVTGFIVNPAWYLWLGVLLRRGVAAEPKLSQIGLNTSNA